MKDIHSTLITEYVRCEEKVIIQVIEEFTKQPLTIENASRVTRIFKQGFPEKYILAYDDTPLGMIHIKFSDCTCNIEFEPGEISFLTNLS